MGIDLGTTNSAMAFVDTQDAERAVRDFRIPQLVAPGTVEARDVLPSFHYEAAAGEFGAGALALPWAPQAGPRTAVGLFARDHGTTVPGRLVGSAKSWLCHSGVNRMASLLPWQGAADVERLSPVAVSARYLGHLRAAWNHAHPRHPLETQEVVLTVPASFDEVARELTVEAAAQAGLPRVVLLEEPQAAFYAWLHAQGDAWAKRVRAGQRILVCDVGGGTTDFTLIEVEPGKRGEVLFHRVAVGEHLILGGDNLDLALAHHIEDRIAGTGKLEPRRWGTLVRTCRQVKETLLGADPPERLTVNVAGSGSRLIGAALTCEVTRAEVAALALEGFMPRVELDASPAARRSGFQEFSLPYAPDPAITRYLAAFLRAHPATAAEAAAAGGRGRKAARDPVLPDLVLFNGGWFESALLRDRLVEVLTSWFGEARKAGKKAPIEVLESARLDLAVARGAAYYGRVRRGEGVRITGGLGRAYYVGVDTGREEERSAVCLLPAGTEEGQGVDLSERSFELLIRRPVEFPLYVSSTRTTDAPGDLVAAAPEQLTALPP
ncbi:MAG: Hsp70 family protein, partial [Planctomycetes bacterium]|nr:Hsp70 family protein [Planctomycetota bacterium]